MPKQNLNYSPLKGRGVSRDLPNRFRQEWWEPEPGEEPSNETELIEDHSASILSANNSPDVPFRLGVNPYRGCEHGCVYCLAGETKILLADGSTKPLADLQVGDSIYGTERRGHYRRYVRTTVLDLWRTKKPSYRVTLEDGTELVASGDHRFLTERGWKFVTGTEQGRHRRPHLTTNNHLMGLGSLALGTSPVRDEDYRRGYLTGMIRGDGLLKTYRYERRRGGGSVQHRFRLALKDVEALEVTSTYLEGLGVPTFAFRFQGGPSQAGTLPAIRANSRAAVDRIRGLTRLRVEPTRSWALGFLAGIFDAEGSHTRKTLRIHNSDPELIDETTRCLDLLGFMSVVERDRGGGLRSVRLLGGARARLRFVAETSPAISRKRDFSGKALKSRSDLGVVGVEPLPGKRDLFDITTGTGDFFANGVVSHNCYARPSHEYLGYSPGLDFERKIVFKPRAAELLREALGKRSYKPEVIALSGNTDCYQPVERRLELTRRCLEVLAECRNPTAVITKSALIARDADLLAELASHGACGVTFSITSLDPELSGILEPRASRPARRLQAMRALHEAGVPVGVLIAPVIPGLNDHEIPAILEAAAAAGATRAGWILLRLPGAVEPLFQEWLATQLPNKRDKVLDRLRGIRGGKLHEGAFGQRMRGTGPYAQQLEQLFTLARRRAGIEPGEAPPLSAAAFRKPTRDGTRQLPLFGE